MLARHWRKPVTEIRTKRQEREFCDPVEQARLAYEFVPNSYTYHAYQTALVLAERLEALEEQLRMLQRRVFDCNCKANWEANDRA
jgi:sulfur transfer protein SufE